MDEDILTENGSFESNMNTPDNEKKDLKKPTDSAYYAWSKTIHVSEQSIVSIIIFSI